MLQLTPDMIVAHGDRVIVRKAESLRARIAGSNRRVRELRDARDKFMEMKHVG